MPDLSRRIYRKIIGLFPDIKTIEPYHKVDLTGSDNVHLVMLNKENERINFILTRHKNDHGRLIADPSVAISVDPNKQTAKVLTYKDPYYFHDVVPRATEIGTLGVGKANGFLFAFLKELKGR